MGVDDSTNIMEDEINLRATEKEELENSDIGFYI